MSALFDRDRHYLYVIGRKAPDVVACIGGWLFDRAMAGWDVTVFVRDFHDAWPLRILGVRTDVYGSAVAAMKGCPGRSALAVAAPVYDEDAAVRQAVRSALGDRRCEVTIWGEPRPGRLSVRLAMTSYPLGPAASAFKTHALAASRCPASNSTVPEVFYTASAQLAERAIVHAGRHHMKGARRGSVMP
jgi:hypothetical protein